MGLTDASFADIFTAWLAIWTVAFGLPAFFTARNSLVPIRRAVSEAAGAAVLAAAISAAIMWIVIKVADGR